MSSKSFINAFMLAIATLAITACVPKATEKKAICGVNEAFSSVSRSCYSIEELRAKPVGVTSTITLDEETPRTITLAYTDSNKDQALTCKISAIPTGLEMIAPSVLDGGLFDKADEVYLAVSNLAAELAISEAAMRAALLKAKASVYFPTVESQFGIFKTAATAILTAGVGSLNPNAQYYYTLGQQRMLVLNEKLVSLANRCECSAGVCATVVIPKLNKTAATSFSYTVTDRDGESNLKSVAVGITAMPKSTAHLAPVARSFGLSLQEHDTSALKDYPFSLPVAADLTPSGSVVPMNYFFKTIPGFVNGETAKGYVTGCMGINGASTTTTSCTYTPKNDGDAFDTITTDLNASAVIEDLTFTAVAKGTTGNSYSVQYFNIKDDNLAVDPYISELEKFGLVTNSSEAFIRVVGNAIKIFIHPDVTSSSAIASLITAHPQASRMVTASAGSPAHYPQPSSAVTLAGGTVGFDSIPYIARNSAGISSTNAAAVHIRMASVDDYPQHSAVIAASDVDEDVSPIIINLKDGNAYSDVDTSQSIPLNYTNVCEVSDDIINLGVNFSLYSCSCTLDVCYANLTPKANASSLTAFTFRYRIGSIDIANPGVTKWTPYKEYALTINPINDAPNLTLGVIPTILEGGVGYLEVDLDVGGSGYEDQTFTLTAASSSTTLFPSGSIVVENTVPVNPAKRRIKFTPAVNQSGTVTITLTMKDSGDVVHPLDVDTTTVPFSLTVTPVNNPPVFLSNITKIETNEGGAVQSAAFIIDEDAGSSADENLQTITLDSVVSDNPSVLPNSAIRFFYDLNGNGVEDVGEARCIVSTPGCPNVLEAGSVTDVKLSNLYLKLDPVDGISGNANITLTISDHVDPADPLKVAFPSYLPMTASASTNFSFIVHPIAALHGGWRNISSVGLKTDKLDAPVSAGEIVCNFDTNRCAGGSCTGNTSPNGGVIPDIKNAVYWDQNEKRCYRSNVAGDRFSWVDFNTSCPVSKVTDVADICSGNSCIHNSGTYPYGASGAIPKAPGQYHYNTSNKTCYVSTDIKTVNDWDVYVPSKVTLAWKPFIMVGSGTESNASISGWNIYRRETGTDYNFNGGHLKTTGSDATYTITDPSVMTFTDKTAIAGKVYYYVVRPVSRSTYNGATRTFPTYTPEIFSEVRVLASPANYSFVHRWIVNQEICNGMNITNSTSPSRIDQTKNFRCEYSGPGQTQDPDDLKMYYDYGRDLLVDSQEVGCSYDVAPRCTANGCIGIGVPTYTDVANGVAADSLYYDRGAGKCYRYPGTGSVWEEFDTTTVSALLANKLRSALNAPLVNVTQAKAVDICAVRPVPTGTQILTFGASNEVILPNKKDYNGYASQKLDTSESDIAEMEQGFALNIQSRCNGSAASGLETAYTDSFIPSTSFIYSLPGSFSSNIRSLYTGSIPWSGSKSTEACVSRFGIQDLYGNVAEWTQDQMVCNAGYGAPVVSNLCTAVTYHATTAPASSFTLQDFATGEAYGFNTKSGPYNDINNSKTVDAGDGFLTQWTFEDQFFGSTKFSTPLALPIASTVDYPGEDFLDYILDIGPSVGIPINRLHKDGIIVNNANLTNATASFAVGGSYLSGHMAGRYTSELIKDDVKRPDVGFRCIVPIDSNTGYPADAQHAYPY